MFSTIYEVLWNPETFLNIDLFNVYECSVFTDNRRGNQMGIELRTSWIVVSACNYWAISPAPESWGLQKNFNYPSFPSWERAWRSWRDGMLATSTSKAWVIWLLNQYSFYTSMRECSRGAWGIERISHRDWKWGTWEMAHRLKYLRRRWGLEFEFPGLTWMLGECVSPPVM